MGIFGDNLSIIDGHVSDHSKKNYLIKEAKYIDNNSKHIALEADPIGKTRALDSHKSQNYSETVFNVIRQNWVMPKLNKHSNYTGKIVFLLDVSGNVIKPGFKFEVQIPVTC